MNTFKQTAQRMISAALKAVDPYRLILDHLQLKDNKLIIQDHSFTLNNFEHIYVIGAGKASASMALALEKLIFARITGGAIIVKYGYGAKTQKIEIIEAGHPIPDENTIKGTKVIVDILSKATQKDLVIVLLSGGGSSLMEMLPQEITLQDLKQVNRALLACGATIQEINAVRKHISLIKGGQLAKQIDPAKGLTLILSDVIGDPLDSIASGPTVSDSTTFNDAWQILEKYQLLNNLPVSVIDHIQQGRQGEIVETPKAGDPIFKNMFNLILGNNLLALKKAAQAAEQDGYKTLILSDRVKGEVQEIAKLMAGIFESSLQNDQPLSTPGCVILGGEPTVTLKGKGKGGRNQELALAVLIQMQQSKKPFYFCSIGTDGTDGPTEAAGAWIDEKSWQKVKALSLRPDVFLRNNDSYHFFKRLNQLIITGPTGTNVMDLMFFLH